MFANDIWPCICCGAKCLKLVRSMCAAPETMQTPNPPFSSRQPIRVRPVRWRDYLGYLEVKGTHFRDLDRRLVSMGTQRRAKNTMQNPKLHWIRPQPADGLHKLLDQLLLAVMTSRLTFVGVR